MTDATERFTALVRAPDNEVALDAGALLIAEHAHPQLDVDVRLAQLDALADAVDDGTADAVAHALFTAAPAFAGNTVDYYDPANSYLDDVLDRRLGIPITLSVLMIEVGRRAGVALHGVGMPGHFLVGAGSGAYYDPFHGGGRLDAEGCAELFATLHGSREAFGVELLAPTRSRAVLDRMLTNLQQTLLERQPAAAAWPTRLRLRFPDLPLARRAELAGLLGRLGQFSEAAGELDRLAGELSGGEAEQATRAAAQLRARAN